MIAIFSPLPKRLIARPRRGEERGRVGRGKKARADQRGRTASSETSVEGVSGDIGWSGEADLFKKLRVHVFRRAVWEQKHVS